jgi:signal peptide peptidase SppA
MNIMRESIFCSAIRSFFNALLAVIGVIVGLAIFAILFVFSSKPYNIQDQTNMTILPNANGISTPLGDNCPVILQIDITNEIGSGEVNSEQIKTVLNSSREGILSSNRVKAIFLNIDSPGGSVIDSDEIYRAIMSYKEKYKVPVHAYVEGLCTSGSFYIACAAEKITAAPTSIIGSVGVITGPKFNFFGLMEQYGVKAKVLTQGLNKAPFLPFMKWPEAEEEKKAEEPMVQLTRYYYQRFVDIVLKSREQMSKTALINDYGATIFAAEQAKEFGYIDDADANRQTALIGLLKAAAIDENGPYQCISLSSVKPFLSEMFQNKLSLFKGTQLEEFITPSKTKPYHRFFYLPEL